MKKGAKAPLFNDLQTSVEVCRSLSGAGDESRTRDLNLGKVALYQLSYSRMCPASAALRRTTRCQIKSGAGDESRTRDLNLGKVALYQLSYSRVLLRYCFPVTHLLRRAAEKRDYVEGTFVCQELFQPFFQKTCSAESAVQVTRPRAREFAAMRASCSTASTRSSAPRRDTSAIRPTPACRSSRRRAAAARKTAASESRPSGRRS